jgi:hypothetical protein
MQDKCIYKNTSEDFKSLPDSIEWQVGYFKSYHQPNEIVQ